ncbi:hypothetical protein V3C99_019164 [Haemonchus contortus]
MRMLGSICHEVRLAEYHPEGMCSCSFLRILLLLLVTQPWRSTTAATTLTWTFRTARSDAFIPRRLILF